MNGVNAYIYWNMALAPKGRSTWGWEQNSMLTIDPASRQAILNPEYFVMKHFSRYAVPGSVRVGLRGPWSGHAVAFRTPEGRLTLVIANPYMEARMLHLRSGSSLYSFELEAESFHTIVIG
ncbi:O-Glycosyl hydrolase family 30 [compost metagenome]